MDLSPEKTARIEQSAQRAADAYLAHRIPHPVGSPERALFVTAFIAQAMRASGLPRGGFVAGGMAGRAAPATGRTGKGLPADVEQEPASEEAPGVTPEQPEDEAAE